LTVDHSPIGACGSAGWSGGVGTASYKPGGGTVEIFEEIDRLGCPEHAGRLILRSLMDTNVNVMWMG
jgi:hypothetical protein